MYKYSLLTCTILLLFRPTPYPVQIVPSHPDVKIFSLVSSTFPLFLPKGDGKIQETDPTLNLTVSV